jgi:hypothetical protein
MLNELVVSNIPHLNGIIITAGGNTATIFVKSNTVHHAAKQVG